MKGYAPVGLAAVVLMGTGAVLAHQLVRTEGKIGLKTAAVDTASLVTGQVRSEFENVIRSLTDLAENLEKPFSLDRDFLDLAVWSYRSGSSQPQRIGIHFNEDYLTPAQRQKIESDSTQLEESRMVAQAFRGKVRVAPASGVDPGAFALLAIPVHDSAGNLRVVSAHIRLTRFQRAFRSEGLADSVLVGSDGFVFARSGGKQNGYPERLNGHPLVEEMALQNHSTFGQIDFRDESGAMMIGAFRKLNVGELAVLAVVPEAALGSWAGLFMDPRALLYGLLFGIAFLAGYYAGYHRSGSSSSVTTGSGTEPRFESVIPEQTLVTVLHASVSQVEELMEALGAEIAAVALNEFYTNAKATVESYQGRFEKVGGASFSAFWSAAENGDAQNWNALRCALDLRRNMEVLNGIRKNDGEKPLWLTMGIDAGLALSGKLGPAASGTYSVVGEVIGTARKLDTIAAGLGVDLLISEGINHQLRNRLLSTLAGQGKLSAETGLREYYTVQGYITEDDQEVMIEAPTDREKKELTHVSLIYSRPEKQRWMVDNGSQAIGPLDAREISERLFSQEFDFDCLCWIEGSFERRKICESGIFSGSEDSDANLWIHDQGMVHGPVSSGFLKTALERGAISPEAWFCEKSTIEGWRRVTDPQEQVKNSPDSEAA